MFKNSKTSAGTYSYYFPNTVKFLPGQLLSPSGLTQTTSSPPVSHVPSLIANNYQRCDFQCYRYGTPFTLCMDSGADCSLLTERLYSHLRQLYNLSFIRETRTFSVVQGSFLNVIGSVTLPVSIHAHDHTFYVNFYIVSNFVLQRDALLGFNEFAKHDISLHPKYQELCHT